MGKLYDDYFVKHPVVLNKPIMKKLRKAVTEIESRKLEPSRKVGRPRKIGALTPAQRQAARRARLSAK